MKIDLEKEEPRLILSAADLRAIEKVKRLLVKIGMHVPGKDEDTAAALGSLEKVISQCERSPTAPEETS